MRTLKDNGLRTRVAGVCLLLMAVTAPSVSAAMLFVSNERGNTVTVLDSNTLKTIRPYHRPAAARHRGGTPWEMGVRVRG